MKHDTEMPSIYQFYEDLFCHSKVNRGIHIQTHAHTQTNSKVIS
jgi:hypothetical protein